MPNAWAEHVEKTMRVMKSKAKDGKVMLKDVLKEAGKTYKKIGKSITATVSDSKKHHKSKKHHASKKHHKSKKHRTSKKHHKSKKHRKSKKHHKKSSKKRKN